MTWGRCHVIRSEARLPLHSHLLLPPLCRPFPGTVLGAPGRVFLKSIPLLCRLLTALGYVLTDSSSLISHFFLCILVLEKSDPHLLFWVSFLGKEDFSVRPRGWSPCPPPPQSLSSLCVVFVCFSFVWVTASPFQTANIFKLWRTAVPGADSPFSRHSVSLFSSVTGRL